MNARTLSIARPLIGLSLISLTLFGCSRPVPPGPPPPPEVTVALPISRTVINNNYFSGRTEAVKSAKISARVVGFLREMHFDPAQDVEEGDLLFTIEKESYQATVAQREAMLASAEANLTRAQADLERVEEALKTNAVSEQEVALRRADSLIAEASVGEARANLNQAKLDLSYCDVVSPISGQVSRNLVDPGNLVGSGENTLLATVALMDPIFVYFEASEEVVLRHLRSPKNFTAEVESDHQPVPAFLGLGGDEDYPHEGQLDYIDNRVDPNTGTITIRGTFPNEDHRLFPGLYARIRIPGQPIEGALLVEEQAVGVDLAGRFVLTVDDKDMVTATHLELGELQGTMRVVLSGLEPGQRYIVNGQVRARAGMPCNPTMKAETTPTSEAAPGS